MPTISPDARATIFTSMGEFTLDLLVRKAPRTVENFVKLAHDGFYDGLTFHRILKDFVIQTGCPKGDGTGGPGYTIRPEFNDTPHVLGTVSMARDNDPHSAGSQFFICAAEASYLDSRFSAFGQVVEGLDVVEKISAVKTHDANRFKEKSTPLEPVYLNRIELSGVEFEPEPEPAASSESNETAQKAQKAEKAEKAQKAEAGEDAADGESGTSGARGKRRRSTKRAEADAPEAAADDQAPASEQTSAEDDKPRRPRKAARARSSKSDSKSDSKSGGKSESKSESKADGEADEGEKKPRRPRRKATKKAKTDADSQE